MVHGIEQIKSMNAKKVREYLERATALIVETEKENAEVLRRKFAKELPGDVPARLVREAIFADMVGKVPWTPFGAVTHSEASMLCAEKFNREGIVLTRCTEHKHAVMEHQVRKFVEYRVTPLRKD